MKQSPARRMVRSAVIAALYVILTAVTSVFGLSGGIIQFRLSEALCVLPALFPEAIPGLFVGCLISNILSSGMPLDILFGSLATLIGAVGAYLLRRTKYLVPLPTVLANTLIIPFVLRYVYAFPGALWYFMLTVGLGEIVCAYLLGILLLQMTEKYRKYLM